MMTTSTHLKNMKAATTGDEDDGDEDMDDNDDDDKEMISDEAD
jgi:hypothetical protein